METNRLVATIFGVLFFGLSLVGLLMDEVNIFLLGIALTVIFAAVAIAVPTTGGQVAPPDESL